MKNSPTDRNFTEPDDLKPAFDFTMGGSLFSPPKTPVIQATELKTGAAEVDLEALCRQRRIDLKVFCSGTSARPSRPPFRRPCRIWWGCFPIQKGLAELLAYLHLAGKDEKAVIHQGQTEIIHLVTEKGFRRQVKMGW